MSKRPEFGTGPHVLEADGIRLAFDSRPVLHDVYLRVQSGQVMGLLLTDHRYAEVLPLCDTVYLLRQGRLLKLEGDFETALRDYGYLAS